MAARILDGKALAAQVRAEVSAAVARFRERSGRAPGLHVVLVGDDPASRIYVRSKERAAAKVGIEGRVHRLPADVPQDVLLELLGRLGEDERVDGILVQLPLPAGLDRHAVVEAIDPRKDVDGLHPVNQGLLAAGRRDGLRPCTPLGCMALLRSAGVPLEGARAVVVGRSELVGRPAAMLLLEANATVTVCHSRTRDLAARVAEAEVLVVAAGRRGLVHGEWVRPGAAVVDVGIHRIEEGGLCGDVDFESARERAGWITPVPGGVGPMTIAMLLRNTVAAAEARLGT